MYWLESLSNVTGKRDFTLVIAKAGETWVGQLGRAAIKEGRSGRKKGEVMGITAR